MTTGMDLRLRRVSLDLKAKDVAAAAGKHESWASRIEARRVVPERQAEAYLTALASLATPTGDEVAAA